MTRQQRWIHLWSLGVLVCAALAAACGGGSEGGQGTGGQTATARSAAATPAAPNRECDLVSLQEVTEIMGTPATFVQRLSDPRVDWSACQFKLPQLGEIFVELTVQPAAKSDSIFADIRRHAKGMLGQSADADRIDLGEGGWAYGSNSMSEAAAVARGRVFHAHMEYMGADGIGNRKEPMVRLVAKMIR